MDADIAGLIETVEGLSERGNLKTEEDLMRVLGWERVQFCDQITGPEVVWDLFGHHTRSTPYRFTTSTDDALRFMTDVGATLQSVHHELKPYMDGKQWRVSVRSGGHYHSRSRTLIGGILGAALRGMKPTPDTNAPTAGTTGEGKE